MNESSDESSCTPPNRDESVASEDPRAKEGPAAPWVLGRRVWLAGLGALQAAQGGGGRVFKDLVERGMERKAQAPSEAARERAPSRRQPTAPPSSALARLGVPTHHDAEHLAGNMERLSENIEHLSDHIEHLSEHVEPIADRLTNLTTQTERLTGQVERLSEHINRLEATTKQLEDSTEAIEKAIGTVKDKVPGM